VITLGSLFVVPQILMFVVSLGQRTVYGGIAYGLDGANYVRALDSLYLGIFARSLGLAGLTTLACLVVGYPLAWWLGVHVGERQRGTLLALVMLPFWTSFLVRMYAWVFLLRTEGVVNGLLGLFGVPPLPLLYSDFAVLLGQVYGELPFMVLPLYASIERLDRTLLEGAADLGASPWRALWRVALPLTRPGIAAGCLLVFIPSLGAYLAPDLLGGARTTYVGSLIQGQFATARDMPFGAALSFLLSLLVVLLLVLFQRPLRASQSG
jgi:spermidine/putrescine transport system permease protein